MPKKRRSRRRKVTIEDVINSVSTIKAHDAGRQSVPRIVMTPRSSQACLVTGVDPECLRIRDLDSFWQPELDPTVQRLRHEAYIKTRSDYMKLARKEREQLMGKKGKVSAKFKAFAENDDAAKQDSKMVKLEEARLAKIQHRQRREIEQMLEWELKVSKMQDAHQQKLIDEANKAKLKKKEYIKRKKLAADQKRERELQRKAYEDSMELQRNAVAKRQFEKERQLQEERKREAARARKVAKQRELERNRQQEEHRQATQAIFQRHQDQIRRRLLDMELREKKRLQLQEEKQAVRQAELERKRAVVERRHRANQKAFRKAEAEKRRAFEARQRANNERRERMAMAKQVELEDRIKLATLNEHRRKLAAQEADGKEEMRKTSILTKRAQQEDYAKQKAAARTRELALKREKRALETQIKRNNVERQARADEFRRRRLEQQLNNQLKRTETMLQKKSDLLLTRKQFSIAAKKKKDSLQHQMTIIKAQKNWKKANKVLDGVKNSGSDLFGGSARPPTRGPQARAANAAKETRNLEKLHKQHRRAAAAAENMQSHDANNQTGGSDGAHYVSPYDIPQPVPNANFKKKKKQRKKKKKKQSILQEGLSGY